MSDKKCPFGMISQSIVGYAAMEYGSEEALDLLSKVSLCHSDCACAVVLTDQEGNAMQWSCGLTQIQEFPSQIMLVER